MSNVRLYLLKYDVVFIISNKLKLNNDYLKFNDSFKNYLTFEKTQGRFPFLALLDT